MEKNRKYYIRLYIECAMDGMIQNTKIEEAISVFNLIKKHCDISMLNFIDEYFDSGEGFEAYLKENNIQERDIGQLIKKSSYEYARDHDVSKKDWQLGYYFVNYIFTSPYDGFRHDLILLEMEEFPFGCDFLLYDIENADEEFINILKGNTSDAEE